MANPYFPQPDGDFFAPIHAITSPTGDLMLFGFRQQVNPPLANERYKRTGSMSAVLERADLSFDTPPARITLEDRGEHRDLSYGVVSTTPFVSELAEIVEADPTNLSKIFFTDRLFCSGHVPSRTAACSR